MTVQEALAASGLDAREARLLLAEASGLSESIIVGFPERALSAASAQRFFDYAQRRKNGEPVAYILGRKEFFGLTLTVNRDVLIPRPETERLVELALEKSFSRAVDLGTGSGAIALALKANRPAGEVVATDRSEAALAVARENSARLGLQVDLRRGAWFVPLADERFDLVVANPPYVAAADSHLADLAYEPSEALVSGPAGLDDLRTIAAGVARHLNTGGWVLLEHGIGQDGAVRTMLEGAGLESVRTWPDLSGIPRVTGGRR